MCTACTYISTVDYLWLLSCTAFRLELTILTALSRQRHNHVHVKHRISRNVLLMLQGNLMISTGLALVRYVKRKASRGMTTIRKALSPRSLDLERARTFAVCSDDKRSLQRYRGHVDADSTRAQSTKSMYTGAKQTSLVRI